jgi:hypothetical protein
MKGLTRAVKMWTMLAALMMAAVWAGGCGPKGDDADAPEAKVVASTVPVHVGEAALRTFRDVITAPGQWHSAGEVVVPAPFAASVEALEPRVGDHVKTGQHLGMLVTHESRATLRGAELLSREASDAASQQEAERALALAKRGLIRVPVVAPRAGIITRRVAEPGAEVAEGAELLALTPEDALVFEARVPAAAMTHVHAGLGARVIEDGALPRAARVQRILPAASTTDQAVLVWLLPSAGGPTPTLEHFGTAELELGVARKALAVPAAAVSENDLDGATRVAMVGADGTATWVTVKVGPSVDGWRELLDAGGLTAGAKLIIEGQHGLPDHTKVAVAP